MKYGVKWTEAMVFDTMEEAKKKAAEVGGKVEYLYEDDDIWGDNPLLEQPKWVRVKML